ncbi:MAG TPA: response regulator transcription factor [Xylella sp.]
MNSPPLKTGLLIDDDALYLRTLQRSLQRRGVETITATDATGALAAARSTLPNFTLLDLKLGEDSGLALIQQLRAIRSDMRILLVTGYASIATAVEAMKRGADDYLPKPANINIILHAIGEDTAKRSATNKDTSVINTMTPLNRLEWEHIQQALHETDGNISAAARLLGMHRRSLQRKLTKRPSPGMLHDSDH